MYVGRRPPLTLRSVSQDEHASAILRTPSWEAAKRASFPRSLTDEPTATATATDHRRQSPARSVEFTLPNHKLSGQLSPPMSARQHHLHVISESRVSPEAGLRASTSSIATMNSYPIDPNAPKVPERPTQRVVVPHTSTTSSRQQPPSPRFAPVQISRPSDDDDYIVHSQLQQELAKPVRL